MATSRPLVAAEVHRGDDVGDGYAARNQARPLIHHAVVKNSGGIVVNITWTDESSAKALLKGGHDLISHSYSPSLGQSQRLTIGAALAPNK